MYLLSHSSICFDKKMNGFLPLSMWTHFKFKCTDIWFRVGLSSVATGNHVRRFSVLFLEPSNPAVSFTLSSSHSLSKSERSDSDTPPWAGATERFLVKLVKHSTFISLYVSKTLSPSRLCTCNSLKAQKVTWWQVRGFQESWIFLFFVE